MMVTFVFCIRYGITTVPVDGCHEIRTTSLLWGLAAILGIANGTGMTVSPKHFTGRTVRFIISVAEPFRYPVDAWIKWRERAVFPLRQIFSRTVGGQVVTRTTVHFLFASILNNNCLVGINQLGSLSGMRSSGTTKLFCGEVSSIDPIGSIQPKISTILKTAFPPFVGGFGRRATPKPCVSPSVIVVGQTPVGKIIVRVFN